ncbi:MAG: hypothetical protein H7327_03435 [Herminiimonas sp.]|nr:hypothetical protein [Herminiimonas sp.]
MELQKQQLRQQVASTYRSDTRDRITCQIRKIFNSSRLDEPMPLRR